MLFNIRSSSASAEAVGPKEMMAMRGLPEHEKADDKECIGDAVKNDIPADIQLQVFDRVCRVPAAEHVVTLQQLMQDDAVEEVTQHEAEKDAGGHGELALRKLVG